MTNDILDKIEKKYPLHLDTVPYFGNYQRHIKLFLYPPDEKPFILKITEGPQAGYEYRALTALRDRLGSSLPEPLYCVETETSSAMACRLVRHQPLKPGHLRQVQPQIVRIFESMAVPVQCNWRKPVSMDDVVGFFERNAAPMNLPTAAIHYLTNLAPAFFNDWPHLPQHGDMTVYNFGICDSQVVLFDWEDFGVSDCGGYDLSTFLISAAGPASPNPERFSAALLFSMNGGFAKSCLDILGASKEDLQRYFLFFMLCFLHLKAHLGYGAQIQNRISDFLRFAFESDFWKNCRN